jgi:hypothetical protein
MRRFSLSSVRTSDWILTCNLSEVNVYDCRGDGFKSLDVADKGVEMEALQKARSGERPAKAARLHAFTGGGSNSFNSGSDEVRLLLQCSSNARRKNLWSTPSSHYL